MDRQLYEVIVTERVRGKIHGELGGCADAWMSKWACGSMGRWTDGWMDEWARPPNGEEHKGSVINLRFLSEKSI